MRQNKVKRLLHEGKPTVGSWLLIGNTSTAEYMAHTGFDWLVVDTEHGPIELETAMGMLQVISATQTVPMVRVAGNDPLLIKRALDIGAYGLVIPMVNDQEEARAAVAACKYPPWGIRSVGVTRPFLYAGSDYVEHANEELLTVLQIEHIKAVERAEAILSVEGVDACFIGPNDLAASLGAKTSLEELDPRVEEAIQQVLAAAKRVGVAAGIHVGSPETANRRIEQGFRFIGLSADLGFLADSTLAALRRVRGYESRGPGGQAAETV